MTEYRKEGIFEKPLTTMNGIAMVFVLIVLVALEAFSVAAVRNPVFIVAIAVAIAFVGPGFFMLQPNEAAVITLFGDYLGTERQPGLRWTLPWNIRKRVSVRARNQNIETLKVNDKRGNPVEIGAVVVWRVEDTAQALFVAETLREELQARVQLAGVKIVEAKLTHLAYAPEIAGAMLRRQQAEAVISARTKIVAGAVSMVEMALKTLSEKNVVELDDERRAAMVSNLMVVLCSDRDAQPVVNAGTLYN